MQHHRLHKRPPQRFLLIENVGVCVRMLTYRLLAGHIFRLRDNVDPSLASTQRRDHLRDGIPRASGGPPASKRTSRS